VILTPKPIDNESYTITDFNHVFAVPAFESSDATCSIDYTISVNPAEAQSAVTFDPNTLTFTIFNDNDISLSGSSSLEYEITVTGTVGVNVASETFTLSLHNPCIDPGFIEFKIGDLNDQQYRVNEAAIEFSHDLVVARTFPFPHDLCGVLGYDTLWKGEYVDAQSVPLAYDSLTNTLTFESDDHSLEGIHEIVIEAYFLQYPSDLWTEMIGQIEIKMDCFRISTLEIPDQIPL